MMEKWKLLQYRDLRLRSHDRTVFFKNQGHSLEVSMTSIVVCSG